MSRSCSLLKKIKPMVGNNVSHSNIKTKRRFYPNLHAINFLSDTLGENIRLKVATRTLRTIYKKGGIDQFLLNTKNGKLTSLALGLKRNLAKIRKEILRLESSENTVLNDNSTDNSTNDSINIVDNSTDNSTNGSIDIVDNSTDNSTNGSIDIVDNTTNTLSSSNG